MTNSRLTDPEILETRHPVRLERFEIRRGSGGPGEHHGGDGVIRDLRFLEPMRANILADRRRVAPRGIKGGSDAEPGRNWVERADGSIENLSATASAEMRPGDRFVIETPGGGGFGATKSSPERGAEPAAKRTVEGVHLSAASTVSPLHHPSDGPPPRNGEEFK